MTARGAPRTGSIMVRKDTAGRESFYGKWTASDSLPGTSISAEVLRVAPRWPNLT